jgi:hypothetical protein
VCIESVTNVQAVRHAIEAATGVTPPPLEAEPAAATYGRVLLRQRAALTDNLAQLHLEAELIESEHPLSMERYGLAFGLLMYRHALAGHHG